MLAYIQHKAYYARFLVENSTHLANVKFSKEAKKNSDKKVIQRKNYVPLEASSLELVSSMTDYSVRRRCVYTQFKVESR